MRFLFYFSLLSILVSCSLDEQTKSTFTLKGEIKNPEKDFLILEKQKDIERKTSTIVDTIFLNENGMFEKSFDLAPHYYLLKIDDKNSIPLILAKGQNVEIKIDGRDQKIIGSPSTEKFLAYEKYRAASLQRLVKTVRSEIAKEQGKAERNQAKIDSLGKLEISNYDKHLAELNDFIKNEIGASLALYPTSMRWKGENNLKLYDSLVSELESSNEKLEIIKRIREKVTRLQQTSIGGMAPDIKMNTPEGLEKSLYEIHDQYTLIEFWASWCGPCRRESPILNKLYQNYKDQGFNIYAVSLDSREKNWLHAIKKDQRQYTNVSSLEGFKTPAAYAYAVTALPMNYIIDKEGKIIAKDIHGEELVAFLEELFKP